MLTDTFRKSDKTSWKWNDYKNVTSEIQTYFKIFKLSIKTFNTNKMHR